MRNTNHIVIDSGSGFIKAGFGGDQSPVSVFSTTTFSSSTSTAATTSIYQSDEKKLFQMVNRRAIDPIQNNKVISWDALEKLWEHAFSGDQLNVNSRECSVHLTEPSFTPKTDREKTTQIMFEKFECPSLYISLDAVLSLGSIGEKTGLVVDSGYDVTNIVPIYKGFKISQGVATLPIGGKHVSKYLEQLIKESGSCGSISSETVNDIKEQCCYVIPKDFESAMYGESSSTQFKQYESKDGSTQLTLFKELFNAPEVLFQPDLFDLSIDPIHKKIYKSLQAQDIDIRKEIYESIYMVGGNSHLSGLSQRLINELTSLAPNNTKINIITLNKYSAWIGASKLCSYLSENNLWISKEEYDEVGPSIINKIFN